MTLEGREKGYYRLARPAACNLVERSNATQHFNRLYYRLRLGHIPCSKLSLKGFKSKYMRRVLSSVSNIVKYSKLFLR